MNKNKLALILIALAIPASSYAEYSVKIKLDLDTVEFVNKPSTPTTPPITEPTVPTQPPEPHQLTQQDIIETINSYGDSSITFGSYEGSVIVNYPLSKDYACTFNNVERDNFENFFHSTNTEKYGDSRLVEYNFYGQCNPGQNEGNYSEVTSYQTLFHINILSSGRGVYKAVNQHGYPFVGNSNYNMTTGVFFIANEYHNSTTAMFTPNVEGRIEFNIPDKYNINPVQTTCEIRAINVTAEGTYYTCPMSFNVPEQITVWFSRKNVSYQQN